MAEYQATEQGTPANPPTGERKLHPKTDGWYQLDSSGNEIKLDNALFGTAAGTNTYTVTIPNHSAAYSQSVILLIKFTNANTGASTLNVNSIGAISIRKDSSSALISGDIAAGQVYPLQYDGTNFQILGKIGGGHIIQNNSVSLTARINLNFTGGLKATDDAGNDQSDAELDLTSVNAFTGQQYFAIATLTDAATISWNMNTQQVAKVTLGGNRTMAAPTNLVAGGTYILTIIQDATGSRTLTWNAVFKWAGGSAPTLTTTANGIDVFQFISQDGTNLLGVGQFNFS